MSDNRDGGIFYSVAAAIVGIGLFAYGFTVLRKARLIENIPTSKTRSVALGLAELNGQAKIHSAPVRTPFADIDCVYFQYEVEELRGSGKNRRWVTIKKGDSRDPFYLEDDTGKILVKPQGAELHLNVDHNYKTGLFGHGDKEKFKLGLQRLGVDPKGFLGLGRSLRCEESYIVPGDNVYVMGTVMDNPKVNASATATDNIMVSRGQEKFFCISDYSEKSLLGTLKLRAHAMLIGGPILAVVGLFFLVKLLF